LFLPAPASNCKSIRPRMAISGGHPDPAF
jgi:hypothetical protein